MFGLSHAGEVGRAVAAGVGGALGGTLIRIVLLDSDIGCPVAMFRWSATPKKPVSGPQEPVMAIVLSPPLAVFMAERVANGVSIEGNVGNG